MSVPPFVRRALTWLLTTAVAAAGLLLGSPPDAGAEEPLRASIHDVVTAEADETRSMRFELELSAPHDAPLSWEVGVGTNDDDGWATPDDVHVPVSLVGIPAGATTATFEVLVTGDDLVEPTELFWVTAASLDDDALDLDAQGVGAIVDDDVVTIDVRDAVVSESGAELRFPVSFSERTRRDVTILYRTVAGTAGETDAALGETEITIPWGSTGGLLRVPVTDDHLIEDDETITLEVLATNAEIGDGTATGMIVNDDFVVPDVAVGDSAASEGDGDISFTITLSEPTTRPVSVAYTTADSTSDNGAKHGRDFLMRSGTVTFEPGITEQTVTVPLVDDRVPELPESFRFLLTGATNGTVVDQRANGAITDDDPVRLGSLL